MEEKRKRRLTPSWQDSSSYGRPTGCCSTSNWGAAGSTCRTRRRERGRPRTWRHADLPADTRCALPRYALRGGAWWEGARMRVRVGPGKGRADGEVGRADVGFEGAGVEGYPRAEDVEAGTVDVEAADVDVDAQAVAVEDAAARYTFRSSQKNIYSNKKQQTS